MAEPITIDEEGPPGCIVLDIVPVKDRIRGQWYRTAKGIQRHTSGRNLSPPYRPGQPLKTLSIPTTVRGFICVNNLVTKVVARLLTKARTSDRDGLRRATTHHKTVMKEFRARRSKADRAADVVRVAAWVANNKALATEYHRLYKQTQRRTNPQYALAERCRHRIRTALRCKGIKTPKVDPTFNLIGTDPGKLAEYLGFQTGDDVHVDHIFPLASFDLSSESELRKAMNWSNLQLLTPTENVIKADNLPTKAMASNVATWAWPPGVTEDVLPDKYDDWEHPLRMFA